MTFTPKDWRDATTYSGGGDTSTPLTAATLEDLEIRVTDYADTVAEGGFRPEDYGAARDGVTDDTEALQDCIDAAMAADNGSTVRLSAGIYLVDDAPRTDRDGHCILSIFDTLDSQKSITIQGTAPSAVVDPAYLNDALSGSRSVIKTTRTTDAYSSSFGPPSVIGGATEEQGISATHEYTGVIRLRDFIVQVPTNPKIGGIDAMSWGGMDAEDVAVVAGTPTTTTVPTNPEGFGWRTPSVWGNNTVNIERCQAVQTYVGFVLHHADHHFYEAAVAYYCRIGFAFQTGLSQFAYPIIGHYWMIEGCPYSLAGWDPDLGLQDIDERVFFADMLVQTEQTGVANFDPVEAIRDPDDLLRGRIDWHHWALTTSAGLPGTVNGASKLDIRTPYAGNMATRINLVPSDSEVMTSQAQVWHDDTAGTPQLKAKAKDSAGAVKQYSLVGGSYSVWRTIFEAHGVLYDGMTNGFNYSVGGIVSDDTNNTVRPPVAGEGLVLSNDHNAAALLTIAPPTVFPFEAADYAMATGGTISLRIKVTLMINATAPARSFTTTLTTADSNGAADTIGTTASGSATTVTHTTPAASSPATANGTPFTAPTDGAYQFVIQVLAGVPASGFAGTVHAYLQLAHTL